MLGNTLTVSIGTAVKIPSGEDNVGLFVKYADEALYSTKRNGKNRITVHSYDINTKDSEADLP